jgi:hypothetical protein
MEKSMDNNVSKNSNPHMIDREPDEIVQMEKFAVRMFFPEESKLPIEFSKLLNAMIESVISDEIKHLMS